MPGPRRLLHNGDYLRLMSGQSISSVGTAMSAFVFTLLAVAITGSPVQAGLVGTAGSLGGLLTSLPAGALVDRVNRRTVLVTCGLIGTALYSSVAVAGCLDHLTIEHLVVVAFASGAAFSFFMPAQNAALRKIVEPEDLGTAMAANEGRLHVAGLLGAPLGGALYSLGRVLPIAFDAVSYLFMTVMLATIRRPIPAPPPAGEKHEPMLRAIRTGMQWVVRQPAIRVMAVSATLVNFAAQGTLLVLVVNLQRRGVHATTIGLLETGIGIGGVLGAVAAPRVLRRFRTGTVGIVAAWAIALAFAATAFTVRPAILVVLLAGAIFLVPAFNSGLFGYQMLITPDGIQGRATSAIGFLANVTTPLAPALGGLLLAHAGSRTALLVFAGIIAISATLLSLSAPIRAIPLLSDAATEHAA